MRHIILLCILFFQLIIVFGQNSKLDSLQKELNSSENNEKKARIYFKLGSEYSNFDLKKSLRYLNEGLKIAIEIDDKNILNNYYNTLGILYFQIGAYELALKHLYSSLRISQANKEKTNIRVIKTNISAIYQQTNELRKALQFTKELIAEVEQDTIQLDKKILLPSLYNNIASIYDDMQQHDKAFEFYFKSQKAAENSKNNEELARVLKNLGDLYLEIDSLEKAKKYLEWSFELRKQIGNEVEICSSYLILSNLYLRQSDYNLALDFAEKANQLAQKLGSIYLLYDSQKRLSEVYEKLGRDKLALTSLKLYNALGDSIFNERVSKEITRLQLEQQYEELQAEFNEKQIKRESKLIITLIVLAALVIFVGMMYYFHTSRIKMQKRNLALENQALELSLESKNKELTTNVMYLVKKNELLRETTEKLLNTIDNFQPDNRKLIQNVIYDLQASVDKDVWEEFELRFNQVHSTFYEKLSNNFSDLTPNEKKLCAFLKLNMSTKEISSITKQSARSIEAARVRLRKKLNIANTNVNLVNFLNEL